MVLVTCAEQLLNQYFALLPRGKPQSKQVNNARIIAHRGAHNNKQGILENTDAAFRLAQEAGCWGIEFDVHSTLDNVFVVNHDPTLGRLWGHQATIAQMTFSDLRALEPGIPSLAEVISRYGRSMHLFIELKNPVQNEETLWETLKGLSPVKDYHLLALDSKIFADLKRLPKESYLLVAGHNNSRSFCNVSLKEQYGGVVGSYLFLTNRRIKVLQTANQSYGVGFVDSKFSLYRELQRGIEWIFTNKTLELSQHLSTLRASDSTTEQS